MTTLQQIDVYHIAAGTDSGVAPQAERQTAVAGSDNEIMPGAIAKMMDATQASAEAGAGAQAVSTEWPHSIGFRRTVLRNHEVIPPADKNYHWFGP